jgi:DNA-binding NarL/FixJ family response regulator
LFAWICFDFAGVLLVRNDAVDAEKAKTLLSDGLGITRSLGMKLLEGRIRDRIRQLEDLLSGKPSYPDELTDREVEVLRLMVGGLTNKQLGQELFISERTVATHIYHIYAKTGVTNRVEAVAYATSHGFAEIKE